jgi:hypothetical protein
MMPSHALLVCLMWCGAPAPQGGEADLTGPPDADDPKFEAVVQMIQASSSIQFDERGQARHQQGYLSFMINLNHANDVFPTSYDNLKFDRVVMSTGEHLQVHPIAGQRNMLAQAVMRQAGARQNPVRLQLRTSMPTWAATRVSEISGTVRVECAFGEPIQAVVGVMKEIEDKTVAVEGMPEIELTVTRQNNQLIVTGNAQSQRLLRSMAFFDAEGREIQASGWAQHQAGQLPRWTFNVKMPDDGTVRVELLPRSRVVDVPILLQHIEMPVLPGGGGGLSRGHVTAGDARC